MAAAKLSQSEIDHLMTQYSGEPEETESHAIGPQKEILNYDFKHPKLVSKAQMRSLRSLHETFARNLSVTMTNSLRTIVDVRLNAIDQVVYSEFVQSIASPSALFMFTVEELGGEAVLEIDPRFCIYAVEKQSGGTGKEMMYRREMTNIEGRIMSRMMKKIYEELTEAWEPFMQLSIEQHSYESNPENIQIISAVEPAIVVFYQVQVYDNLATLNICYPYALLEEALNNSLLKYSNQMRKDDLTPDQRKQYETQIKKVQVPVNAILGETKITLRELVDLEVGDAISLNQRTENPISLKVNNKVKMKGYPGLLHKHRAVKIYDIQSIKDYDEGAETTAPAKESDEILEHANHEED